MGHSGDERLKSQTGMRKQLPKLMRTGSQHPSRAAEPKGMTLSPKARSQAIWPEPGPQQSLPSRRWDHGGGMSIPEANSHANAAVARSALLCPQLREGEMLWLLTSPPGSNLLPKRESSAKGPETQLQEKSRQGSESKRQWPAQGPRGGCSPVVHVPPLLFSLELHRFHLGPFSASVLLDWKICPQRAVSSSTLWAQLILQILIMHQICARHSSEQWEEGNTTRKKIQFLFSRSSWSEGGHTEKLTALYNRKWFMWNLRRNCAFLEAQLVKNPPTMWET